MANTSQSQQRPQPWPSVAGLLAACVVTLLGVWRRVDPDVLLIRSIGAAVAVGTVISVAAMLLRWLVRMR